MKKLVFPIQIKLYLPLLFLFFSAGLYSDTRELLEDVIHLFGMKKTLQLQYATEATLLAHKQEVTTLLADWQTKIGGYAHFDNKPLLTAELLSTILQAGTLHGVLINSILPEEWQMISGVNRLSIHLQASASFLQVQAFLREIAHNKSLFVSWQTISFVIDKQGMGQLDVVLVGMYFPILVKQPTAIVAELPLIAIVQETYRDPFSHVNDNVIDLTNQIFHADTMLQSLSIRQIKWVGYLHDHERFWALAKLPDGSAVAVAKGMQIGREKGTILRLSESEIVVDVGGQKIRFSYSL